MHVCMYVCMYVNPMDVRDVYVNAKVCLYRKVHTRMCHVYACVFSHHCEI